MATVIANLNDLSLLSGIPTRIPINDKKSLEVASIEAEKAIASLSTPIQHVIPQELKVSISNPNVTAVVIQPFIVETALTETGEEYIATGYVSNVYELAATPDQALKSYLKALVDELAWLEKNEKSLSPSILEELYRLQYYIRIV